MEGEYLGSGYDPAEFDPSQLDPSLVVPGLTPEQIAAIPHYMLRAHHPVFAAEAARQHSPQSQPAPAPSPAAIASSERRFPPPAPGVKTYKISTEPPNGDESDVEDESEPTRAQESLVDPLWDRADAVNKKATFGKLDCTIYADGQLVRGEDVHTIERGVRLVCAFLWTMELDGWDEHQPRNYQLFMIHYMWLLKRIAKKLELMFPILGWCSGHYKALRWIEMHIKSHNATINKKRKRIAQKQQLTGSSAKTLSSSQSSAKTSPAKISPIKRSSPKAKVTLNKSLNHDAPEDGDEFDDGLTDDEDVDESPRKKPFPRKELAAQGSLANRNDPLQMSRLSNVRTATPNVRNNVAGRTETHSFAPNLPQRSQILIPKAASATTAAANDVGPSSQLSVTHSTTPNAPKRSQLMMPTGAFATALAMDDETSNARMAYLGAAVGNFQGEWSDKLLPGNPKGIRAALSRFSALEELDLLRTTLSTLETAQNCGIDPNANGSPGFDAWVKDLETLQGNEGEDDEDERGGQFGHRAVGRFGYKDKLTTIEAWGSVSNACKLIAALLRIWTISRQQMASAASVGDTIGDPLIHNHIRNVCELVNTIFQVKHNPSSSTQSSSLHTSASTSKAARGKENMSIPRLRRLGQKRALRVLELADIQVVDKKKAIDMLITACENGVVSLTPAQLVQLELNEPIEGSVTPNE